MILINQIISGMQLAKQFMEPGWIEQNGLNGNKAQHFFLNHRSSSSSSSYQHFPNTVLWSTSRFVQRLSLGTATAADGRRSSLPVWIESTSNSPPVNW